MVFTTPCLRYRALRRPFGLVLRPRLAERTGRGNCLSRLLSDLLLLYLAGIDMRLGVGCSVSTAVAGAFAAAD